MQKAQNSAPATPSAADTTAIDHMLKLKFLESERNKLYSEFLQQKPPAKPQEPTLRPPTAPNSPRPPLFCTQSQSVSPTPAPLTHGEEPKDAAEEPFDLLVSVDDSVSQEKHSKMEGAGEPPKVRRRFDFRHHARPPHHQGESPVSEESHLTKNQEPKGQLVYSKDTGEKLGVITDVMYDKQHNIVGYTLQPGDANTPVHYPADQFTEGKQGLLFIPSWYRNAIATIEKLEFVDKVSPELPSLVQNGMFNEELYDLLMKRDEHFSGYLDEAIELKELLHLQIQLLEERRRSLSEKANALMVKRVMEEITRNAFAEHVQVLRRKTRLLDLNIQQCTTLLQRLNDTSVGLAAECFVEPGEPQGEDAVPSLRASRKRPSFHTDFSQQDHEPGLTDLIVQLVEERIMADLKRQLTQEKPHWQAPNGRSEDRQTKDE